MRQTAEASSLHEDGDRCVTTDTIYLKLFFVLANVNGNFIKVFSYVTLLLVECH